MQRWSCPHHHCAVCHRKTQAAGGLLFRCEVRSPRLSSLCRSAAAVTRSSHCLRQTCNRHGPQPHTGNRLAAAHRRSGWRMPPHTQMCVNACCEPQVCANAFCEDHLPGDAHLEVHCRRFQALGQVHPKQVLVMPPRC